MPIISDHGMSGRVGADFFGQEASSFTDDLKMPYKPVLEKFICFERFASARGVSLNVTDGVEDVLLRLAGFCIFQTANKLQNVIFFKIRHSWMIHTRNLPLCRRKRICCRVVA